jgi:hypothetical protein
VVVGIDDDAARAVADDNDDDDDDEKRSLSSISLLSCRSSYFFYDFLCEGTPYNNKNSRRRPQLWRE